MTTKNTEFKMRANEAAEKFLYRRGYDILETQWTCEAGTVDVVAREDDALVFVDVRFTDLSDSDFPGTAMTEDERRAREAVAMAYLSESDFIDMRIRFDTLDVKAVAPDRAILRHHINAMSLMAS